jgi:structure-specific endonuclease subunit SLX1
MKSTEFFVYLLVSTDNATYVGATVDLDHRLRQHNKEIKGGAHATSAKVAKGETWTRVCHVAGFPDWSAALQFEWRWKQLSRKLPQKMLPLERRFEALDTLLSLDRPTSKAMAYAEWPSPPSLLLSCVVGGMLDLSRFSTFKKGGAKHGAKGEPIGEPIGELIGEPNQPLEKVGPK